MGAAHPSSDAGAQRPAPPEDSSPGSEERRLLRAATRETVSAIDGSR
jgi:hypothetical protein